MTARAVVILAFALAGCSAVAESPQATRVPSVTPTPRTMEPTPEGCIPPPLGLRAVIDQQERAACYGSAELTLEAHAALVGGVVDCPGELEPSWLGCGGQMVELFPLDGSARPVDIVLAARSRSGLSLWAVVHPDSGIDLRRGLDAPVRVTGHFDDPAAVTCRYTRWPDNDPPSVEEVVTSCQSQFVITEFELLDVTGDNGVEVDPSTAAFSAHDIAQVVTTDLVVRSAPGIGADSSIFDSTLDVPTLLYIFDGPVVADGYDWYLVMPSRVDYLPSGYGVGWVAAGSKEGEPWIGRAVVECPPPTLEELAALSGLAALSCFGATGLEIEGDLGCVQRDPVAYPAQRWSTVCGLTRFDCCPDVVPYPSGMAVFLEPGPGWPLPYTHVQPARIVGRFDDASAGECEDAAQEGAGPVPAGWGRFVCRTSFVVSDIVPIGEPVTP